MDIYINNTPIKLLNNRYFCPNCGFKIVECAVNTPKPIESWCINCGIFLNWNKEEKDDD